MYFRKKFTSYSFFSFLHAYNSLILLNRYLEKKESIWFFKGCLELIRFPEIMTFIKELQIDINDVNQPTRTTMYVPGEMLSVISSWSRVWNGGRGLSTMYCLFLSHFYYSNIYISLIIRYSLYFWTPLFSIIWKFLCYRYFPPYFSPFFWSICPLFSFL